MAICLVAAAVMNYNSQYYYIKLLSYNSLMLQ